MFKNLCCGMFSCCNKKVTPKITYEEVTKDPPKIKITSPSPTDQGERVMRCLGIRDQFFSYGTTLQHQSFNFKETYYNGEVGDFEKFVEKNSGAENVFN